jgi:ribulose-phosphate 3-epimerase
VVTIAPTITTDDPLVYKQHMLRIAKFATRVHIDLADGEFAPTKLTPINEVWWAHKLHADVHAMFKNPFKYIKIFLAMKPDLLIVHAESEGDFETFAKILKKHDIKVGVALLPKTKAETIVPALEYIDHVLIFGGKLGFQGGKADLKNLKKVRQIRKHKPGIEISWDGGINNKNAAKLIKGGIDVLNVGGYIAKAVNPYAAYATLKSVASIAEAKLDKKEAKQRAKSTKKEGGNEHRRFRAKSK